MSRKWRKYVALVVLVCFVALLTKTLWHDCTHREHLKKPHHSTAKFNLEQGAEKCYVCDLHIPLLSRPADVQHPFARFLASANPQAIPAAPDFGTVLVESLRGPPYEMI